MLIIYDHIALVMRILSHILLTFIDYISLENHSFIVYMVYMLSFGCPAEDTIAS